MNGKKVNLTVAAFALMAALLLPMSAFAADPQYRGRSGNNHDRYERRHDRAHDRFERRHDRFHDRFGDRNNRRHRSFHREIRRDHRQVHNRRVGNNQRRFFRRW